MLSIVILGMGIDYAIFCVRAHQRYRVSPHPSYVLVRSAVFLAGASTLIGFGVLCFAEHCHAAQYRLTLPGYRLFPERNFPAAAAAA